MKNCIFIFSLIFLHYLKPDNHYVPENETVLHGDAAKKVLHQCSRSSVHSRKLIELTAADLDSLHEHFKEISNVKSEFFLEGYQVRNLDGYLYQYAGVTIKGEKFIYLNALPYTTAEDIKKYYGDWKTQAVVVCDGGHHYWGILFSLKNCTFYDLSLNGPV